MWSFVTLSGVLLMDSPICLSTTHMISEASTLLSLLHSVLLRLYLSRSLSFTCSLACLLRPSLWCCLSSPLAPLREWKRKAMLQLLLPWQGLSLISPFHVVVRLVLSSMTFTLCRFVYVFLISPGFATFICGIIQVHHSLYICSCVAGKVLLCRSGSSFV